MNKIAFKVLSVKRNLPLDIRPCSDVRYSVYGLYRNHDATSCLSFYLTRIYSSYNFWKAKKFFDSHESVILVEE